MESQSRKKSRVLKTIQGGLQRMQDRYDGEYGHILAGWEGAIWYLKEEVSGDEKRRAPLFQAKGELPK